MSSAFWLTEATTLPQNGKIILQLRIIFLFFSVSSLEINMKNMDLNHTSARGYLLFLLIIQTLEEKRKNPKLIFFLIIFDTFLGYAVHLVHSSEVLNTTSVYKGKTRQYSFPSGKMFVKLQIASVLNDTFQGET